MVRNKKKSADVRTDDAGVEQNAAAGCRWTAVPSQKTFAWWGSTAVLLTQPEPPSLLLKAEFNIFFVSVCDANMNRAQRHSTWARGDIAAGSVRLLCRLAASGSL